MEKVLKAHNSKFLLHEFMQATATAHSFDLLD
jgi:hypothetical protein